MYSFTVTTFMGTVHLIKRETLAGARIVRGRYKAQGYKVGDIMQE